VSGSRLLQHVRAPALGLLNALCACSGAGPTLASTREFRVAGVLAGRGGRSHHPPPRGAVDVATYKGWQQYSLQCARCHGEDGQGKPQRWPSRWWPSRSPRELRATGVGSIDACDETASLTVTQMRVAGVREAKRVSEDGVHAVYTNASLEQEGADVAIGLDNQGQGTQGLRNFRGVVAFARLVVDEHRPWGRKSSFVGEGLIGEEQTLLVPNIERLQAETARAVSRRDFDMGRMPVLRGS
jgi:hypothetical protein